MLQIGEVMVRGNRINILTNEVSRFPGKVNEKQGKQTRVNEPINNKHRKMLTLHFIYILSLFIGTNQVNSH